MTSEKTINSKLEKTRELFFCQNSGDSPAVKNK